MKAYLLQVFFAVVVSFISIACAADTGADSSPKITVELRDGSRVMGSSVQETLSFRSPLLGEIKLNAKDIRVVDCVSSNNIKLTTTGGDVITVFFKDSAIRIKTSFGKVELTTESIRRFTVTTSGIRGENNGIVALWSGENGGRDLIGNNNAELRGVTLADDKLGGVFCFNGYDSYLRIRAGSSCNVGMADGFSVKFWIKISNTDKGMALFEFENNMGTSNGADVGVHMYVSQPEYGTEMAGRLWANILDVGQTSHFLKAPVGSIIADKWQQAVFTYDKATGVASAYANGAEIAHIKIGSINPQTSFPNLLIGARTTYGSESNPRDAFSGRMSEISLYNRALTPEEIREDFEIKLK